MEPQSSGAAWPHFLLPVSSVTTRLSCISGTCEAMTPASTCAGWRCWAWVSGQGMGLGWWWRKVRCWEVVSPPGWRPQEAMSLGVRDAPLRPLPSLSLCALLPQPPSPLPHAEYPQLGAGTVLLLRAGFYAVSFLSVAVGSTLYYQGKCE